MRFLPKIDQIYHVYKKKKIVSEDGSSYIAVVFYHPSQHQVERLIGSLTVKLLKLNLFT